MAAPQRSARKAPPWLRNSIDAAPAILFLAVLLISHQNFRLATWVLMGSSALALAANLIVERKIAPLPAFSGGLALVFGALSLIFHNNDILKRKMTVVDGVLGAILIVGIIIKKNPLKKLLGSALNLSDAAWNTLAIRYAIFWWACAIANEIVLQTQSDKTWGIFRLVILGVAVVFSLAQTPFLLKQGAFNEPDKTLEPPDPGF